MICTYIPVTKMFLSAKLSHFEAMTSLWGYETAGERDLVNQKQIYSSLTSDLIKLTFWEKTSLVISQYKTQLYII